MMIVVSGDDNLDDMVFDDFDVGNNEEDNFDVGNDEEDQNNDLFAASPCSLWGLNQLFAWCQSEYVGNRFEYIFSNQYFL